MREAAPLDVRLARRSDVEALVALYADDAIGQHGDTVDEAYLPHYLSAFDDIAASESEFQYVAEQDGRIVGTFKLSILSVLTGRGSKILVIQSVQTEKSLRGQGIGSQMISFAIAFAKERDLGSIQLVSNANRIDAHRFYERLGFAASHIGFKMELK